MVLVHTIIVFEKGKVKLCLAIFHAPLALKASNIYNFQKLVFSRSMDHTLLVSSGCNYLSIYLSFTFLLVQHANIINMTDMKCIMRSESP